MMPMEYILAVALSGGVDSSVAAFLLSKEWDRPDRNKAMVGVSHIIWPDSKSCNEETLSRAEAVCKKVEIPFKRYDFVDSFTRCVVDDFVMTYLAGRTPNPCVRCNERIRFGLFYDRVREDVATAGETKGSRETDNRFFFATGHYVRRMEDNDRWLLRRGVDQEKDQSYMLYKINPRLLPYLRFPLGVLTKTEVVDIARREGLPTASVKESQDICFISDDYPAFICSYDGKSEAERDMISAACGKPGNIIDTSGRILGPHRGYIHYTIGQRRGLGLSDGPWYVVGIDAGNNIVVVGRREEGRTKRFHVSEVNWFVPVPKAPVSCNVKIRYNSPDIPCRVVAADTPGRSSPETVRNGEAANRGLCAEVELEKAAAVTPGQSAVFYDGDLVIGGGIISGDEAIL